MGWKNYNIKKLSMCILGFFVCTLLLCFITSFVFFPSHIQLLKDKDNNFNFSLPIKAVIYLDDNLDSIEVNNVIVSDNMTIKLNKNINIKAKKLGKADMKLNAFGIPVKTITLDIIQDKKVVPVGMTVGVKINTDGIMVLGTGYVNGEDGQAHKPSEGILESGDLIINANGKQLNKKEDLMKLVEDSNSIIKLLVKRDNEIIETKIQPVKSYEDKTNKIGVWVRDSTQGIGTITYYNPSNNKFGALGHGILDIDTKKLMTVNNGEIMKSEVVSIQKGEKGVPGELIGDINKNNIIGEIKSNTKFGLYGYIDIEKCENINKDAIPIGLQNDIHEGSAQIMSNIEGSSVKYYDIVIESVNKYSTDNSKGMIIRITDKNLLSKTNGIVQGMSGSPIIQSGKLIGAVTHVFVQDPTKGYGTFIENMIKQDIDI